MEKRTIAQAAMEVLKVAQQPMTAQEITQVILEQDLYSFNTKDQKGMVRRAIEKRCERTKGKDSVLPKYFEKLPDGKYRLKNAELK